MLLGSCWLSGVAAEGPCGPIRSPSPKHATEPPTGCAQPRLRPGRRGCHASKTVAAESGTVGSGHSVERSTTEPVDDLTASVELPVSQKRAFTIFVHEFSSWWPPEFSWSGANLLVDVGIDARVGGALYEIGPHELRRSEERRVGKECRSRWSPDHGKNRVGGRRNAVERNDRAAVAIDQLRR